MSVVTAESLGIPATFNVATHFVDRNVDAGRGAHVAIECGDQRITYAEVLANVNRVGSALRRLGVRPEERVVLLLPDGPEFVYSFFGAIKIGAVPIPLNTLWKPADYGHVLHDSRAVVVIVADDLLPAIEAVPAARGRSVRHVIAAGPGDVMQTHLHTRFSMLVRQGSDECEAEPTHRDAPAFWLYSSGSTGMPKGCVHLHHDMVVCAELFGKGILRITGADRTFSVAKLFFAYGLGNALYFPFSVGATTILWPGHPTPVNVYAVIERFRPTLFYSVPTGFAMLLARIMVERGQVPEALAVLQRHASPPDKNPDFHAFAGALYQRLGRHKEAIQQYESALRLAPSAGVWWVGLGISLQAAEQPKEATDAYTRAKSAGLTPELASFVEQRLKQLQ